ncbi:MAG: hypothetical protein CMP47_00750 [Rickettsiales bacterium]|jgi:hypothetical protein|nr:hypothetical protein [Rickettsiales bacterium]
MNPEELLEKLKKDSSPTVKKTLDAIYQICCEQKKRKDDDFSVVTISRLGYKRGVPKAQTIRNKSGIKYKALINAFAKEVEPSDELIPNKHHEAWIEEIDSPKLRLLARMLASELREANEKIKEIIPPNQVITIYDNKPGLNQGDHALTEQERRAIEYLLSKKFTKRWMLKSNEYGEYLDEEGTTVFKPGTLTALKKALDYL